MELSKKVKNKIEELIDIADIENSKKLLDEYYKIGKDDFEYYSYSGIIKIIEQQFENAIHDFKTGLLYNDYSFDLNYNLGYAYENIGDYSKAHWHYSKCKKCQIKDEQKIEINDKLIYLESLCKIDYLNYDTKIVFFVKKDMDSFLEDIVYNISKQYNVLKLIITEYSEIDLGMDWANICWFEWCDELIVYGSKLSIAQDKKIICRLHSYEAFTDYILNVNWMAVDKLILISEAIKDYVSDIIDLEKSKITVIPNGLNLENWTFSNRNHGFNIAYVGYINYKKGPMLLLHAFKAIYDIDSRYNLYIAGKFQDDRDLLYFKQMIKEFGLEDNFFFQGWQDDLDTWLEDKNYIICTSVLESQNMSVIQAMAKGIKPLVHNFVGARGIYNQEHLWNTLRDLTKLLQEKEYESENYRDFVKGRYESDKCMKKIEDILNKFSPSNHIKDEEPLVTIGITNFNGKQYLETCINSFLNQNYSNIELILVDDCSTDGSKEIIESYETKYSNIKGIYHTINSGGASKGIQEIISNASGSFFQWIACDDYVEKDSVKNFVDFLQKNPEKDYVYSNLNIVDDNNNKYDEWGSKELEPKDAIVHIFKTGSGIIPMNCMHRTSFFRNNNINWIVYMGNDFSADTLNSLHLIKHNWRYAKINKSLINYRLHNDNASHNLKKRIETSLSLFEFIINNFSVETYLSEINWNKIINKEQYKNYIIADFYYNLTLKHISGEMIPSYLKVSCKKEEIMIYSSVFVKKALKYLEIATNLGDKHIDLIHSLKLRLNSYENEILEISGSIIKKKSSYLLSICIPTYNRAKRLDKCLESIFNQIGHSSTIEVVVSDNASQDNTQEIVEKYMIKYSNIRYYRNNKNLGFDKNFLKVCLKARGEYIFLHGDDDYFRANALNRIFDILQANNECPILFIDVRDHSNTIETVENKEIFLKKISIYATFISSIIMKREYFNRIQDKTKWVGTNIIQIHWIYYILEEHNWALILNSNIYLHEEDNAPGGYTYSFANTMIKSYFDILGDFFSKNSNKKIIREEKKRLVGRTLWYYEFGLKRKEKIFLEDFDEIFYDYYKDEEYYQEASEIINNLKKKYNC